MSYFEEFIGVNFWTALFVLLNTLTIFFVARKFLFNPVMKIINDRQQEIDDLYTDADRNKEAAASLRAEYEEKLSEAKKTGEAIVRDAMARGQAREEEILRQANREADAIRQKALTLLERYFNESGSKDPKELVLRGQVLYQAERYDDAIPALREAIEASEDVPDSWTQTLMSAYAQAGRDAEATAMAEQIAAKCSSSVFYIEVYDAYGSAFASGSAHKRPHFDTTPY